MQKVLPLIVAGLGLGAGLALMLPPPPRFTTTGEPEQAQDLENLAPVLSLLDTMTDTNDSPQADNNVAAFLAAIRWAEGTADANGYRRMFGGALFDSFADHPRRAVRFTNKEGRTLWTSAAGAYQFLAISPIPGGSTKVDTWDRLQEKLGLPDFSPASQDAAAVELIREAGALGEVKAGNFAAAVQKVRRIWASMPGAGYAQPEKTLERLAAVYQTKGGTLA